MLVIIKRSKALNQCVTEHNGAITLILALQAMIAQSATTGSQHDPDKLTPGDRARYVDGEVTTHQNVSKEARMQVQEHTDQLGSYRFRSGTRQNGDPATFKVSIYDKHFHKRMQEQLRRMQDQWNEPNYNLYDEVPPPMRKKFSLEGEFIDTMSTHTFRKCQAREAFCLDDAINTSNEMAAFKSAVNRWSKATLKRTESGKYTISFGTRSMIRVRICDIRIVAEEGNYSVMELTASSKKRFYKTKFKLTDDIIRPGYLPQLDVGATISSESLEPLYQLHTVFMDAANRTFDKIKSAQSARALGDGISSTTRPVFRLGDSLEVLDDDFYSVLIQNMLVEQSRILGELDTLHVQIDTQMALCDDQYELGSDGTESTGTSDVTAK